MKQEFYNLKIHTNGQKLYDFTEETIKWINKNNFNDLKIKYVRIKLQSKSLNFEFCPSYK